MTDPIVEEVRRHRMEHTRKFDGELRRICEDLRRIQQTCGCKIIRRPPRLLTGKDNTSEEKPGTP